jgi:serine phosphatase RsbU (regulator of sigma subunit)
VADFAPMLENAGRAESARARTGLSSRLVRGWVALTTASPAITDPEEQRRAGMLCTVTCGLALVLTVAAVISLFTSWKFPSRSSSLGYGGTGIVAGAAALFWVALWLAKRPRYEIGAWLTVVTIDLFLLALGPFFHGVSATLAIGFAVPVLCATLFLHARGTVAVFFLSAVLGTIHLIIAGPSAIQFSFIIAIMVVVTGLTVLVAYIREQDLASVKRLGELEQRDAERLRGELELASKVQRAMLPDHVPATPGIDVAAYSQPAFEASGDFYDLFHVGHTVGEGVALGIVVCDVAGKGVASALIMSAARAALRAEAERTPSPAAVLAKVNNVLAASVPAGLFVTLFYGIFDPVTSTLRFSSGGHPHPFRGSATRNGIDELESYGLPLGLIAGSEYEDRTAVLEPGDFLVVYTDGLVEALNADREMYGFDGARQYLARTSGELTSAQDRLDRCLSDMRRFVDGERLHDDVTLVTLQVLGDRRPGADTPAQEVEWTSGL